MSTIRNIILFIAVLLAGTACTVNNGDIGDLYGTWNIESVTVDGQPYDSWATDDFPYTTVEFQNNICMIKRIGKYHDMVVRVSTWSWTGGSSIDHNVISLDFNHSDDNNPASTGIYEAPAWLLLGGMTKADFQVTYPDRRTMLWTTVTDDGLTISFRMRRTW